MNLSVFLKGMLMGICDTVPGISGGTIAFITGIYSRLIESIKAFTPRAFANFFVVGFGRGDKAKAREDLKGMDLGFLLPLVFGILLAVFLFSRVMEFLLADYFVFTMAFFVGLIISSAVTLFRHIEHHHTSKQVMGLLGLLIGISFAFLVPTEVNATPLLIILSGAIAISAMILPGISGSFILLIMGMYETIISAVSNITTSFSTLLLFAAGALVGLFSITRIVSYVFHKNKNMTLYFLVGLVIGALSVPVRDISLNTSGLGTFEWVIMALLVGIGSLVAAVVSVKGKK